ncbi:MAG: hypothetical protein COB65_02895 [Thalassobium sp.]|nr:MAG: hypothetical protein COB65_02895 [Thalassobium sp.]
MTKKPNDQRDPLAITPDEHQEIIQDIRHSNEVRRNAQLPLIDEKQSFAREVQLRIDKKYRTALEPYLVLAYQRVDVQVGLPGRIAMTQQAFMMAESALLADRGIANPNPRPGNLIKTMIRYSNGTLASLGVS